LFNPFPSARAVTGVPVVALSDSLPAAGVAEWGGAVAASFTAATATLIVVRTNV